MIIRLINFRCYLDTEFEFESGRLILLSGSSGAGKSSIFMGIFWCLYGSLRNVYNSHHEKSGTSVTITFQNLSIYRQGKPGLLQVSVDKKVYEDQVAQDIINSRIGIKDIWKACCYIEQNNRCGLLSGSNQLRLNLLNNLAFTGEGPEESLSLIESRLQREIQDYNVQNKILENNQQAFQERFRIEFKWYIRTSYREVDLSLIEKALMDLNQKLKQLQAQEKFQLLNQGVLKQLQQELDELPSSEDGLIVMKGRLDRNIEELQNQEQLQQRLLQDRDDYIQTIARHEYCRKRLSILTNELEKIQLEDVDEDLNIEQHRQRIIELSILIKRTKPDYEVNIDNKAKRDLIQKQLNQLPKVPPGADIKGLEFRLKDKTHKLEHIQNLNRKTQHNLQIQEEIQKLEIIGEPERISQEQLLKTKEQEKAYLINSELSNSLSVDYDSQKIQQNIQQVQNQLDNLTQIKGKWGIITKIKQLEHQLRNIPDSDISQDQIDQLARKLEAIRQGLDVLKCPHCNQSVRYVNNTLIKSSTETPTNTTELERCHHWLQVAKKQLVSRNNRLEIQRQLGNLVDSLEGVSKESQYSLETHNKLSKLINNLNKIKMVSKPSISYERAHKIYLYWTLKDQLQITDQTDLISSTSLEQEIIELNEQLSKGLKRNGYIESLETQCGDLVRSLEMLVVDDELILKYQENLRIFDETQEKFNQLSEKQSKIQTHRSLKEQIGMVKKELNHQQHPSDVGTSLTECQQSIKSLNKDLELIRKQIQYLELKDKANTIQDTIDSKLSDKILEIVQLTEQKTNKLEKIKKYLEIRREHSSLKSQEGALKNTYNQLAALSKLKQLAIETEYEQLQSVVDSINTTVSEILTAIFEDPISVSLQLFKELKTDKRIKPLVNLKIDYKGSSYDNINNLSGGEGDRISLAFLVALNRILGSPFILLDECISSLNQSVRTECIESIRGCLPADVICIVVNHEDVEGNYDQVIHI